MFLHCWGNGKRHLFLVSFVRCTRFVFWQKNKRDCNFWNWNTPTCQHSKCAEAKIKNFFSQRRLIKAILIFVLLMQLCARLIVFYRKCSHSSGYNCDMSALGFCDRASGANCEMREKTNKMQQLDVYFQHCLNMFRASSGEKDVCYCMWCAALVLLDVVGSGCGALPCGVWALWRISFTALAPHKAAPHNRYKPHPAEPAQHTTCSNIRLLHLKMGIMMPETCWEIVENKHLNVASCWFSLSLYNACYICMINRRTA